MPHPLHDLLAELEHFGLSNDAAFADRSSRMLNITRDTGEFLSVVVRATNAKRILEIGTSNGYSTLWLADAARAIGGHVNTVELSDFKVGLAADNFARASLSAFITQHHGEAGPFLASAADASFDLIFLDSERGEYPHWWPDLKRIVRKGGLLIVDNAISHAEQMAPFAALVEQDPDFTTCTASIGKGEFLATRSAA